MSKRVGVDAYLGTGKETTWGTQATTTLFSEMMGESGGYQPNLQIQNTWRSRGAGISWQMGTKHNKGVTVPFTFEGSVLHLLRGVFTSWNAPTSGAADANAGTPAIAYGHTFRLGGAASKGWPLTLEIGSTTKSFFALGSYVKTLKIEATPTDVVKLSVETVGKTELQEQTSTTSTIPAQTLIASPANWTGMTYGAWTTPSNAILITETGDQLAIDGFSVAIDTGMDDGRMKMRTVGSSASITEPEIAGPIKVTGSFSRDYILDKTQGSLLAGTNAGLVMTWTGPVISTSPAASYSLEIRMNKIVFSGNPIVHPGPGMTQESMDFVALDDGTVSPIQIKIVNRFLGTSLL